jgi:putative flippase GtrA
MEFEKINNKGQAQLFRNPYLEMLTKTHPLVIWGMYTPVMIYMVYYSGTIGFTTGRIALTFLIGMFSWTLFEYIAHRFLFHMIANSGRAKRFIYTLQSSPLPQR